MPCGTSWPIGQLFCSSILGDSLATHGDRERRDARTARFYFAFTSNIDSEETMRMENVPFASVERTVLMRRECLRPELLGRINEIVVYSRLSYATQREICLDMIGDECARLATLGYRIEVTAPALEFLIRRGYHRTLGARPMRGAVERYLQEAVAFRFLLGSEALGYVDIDAIANQLIMKEAAHG